MTEIGLFIAGGLVTLVVFVGLLLYGMMSFSQWSKDDQKSDRRLISLYVEESLGSSTPSMPTRRTRTGKVSFMGNEHQ